MDLSNKNWFSQIKAGQLFFSALKKRRKKIFNEKYICIVFLALFFYYFFLAIFDFEPFNPLHFDHIESFKSDPKLDGKMNQIISL